jgi:hypothetical protein
LAVKILGQDLHCGLDGGSFGGVQRKGYVGHSMLQVAADKNFVYTSGRGRFQVHLAVDSQTDADGQVAALSVTADRLLRVAKVALVFGVRVGKERPIFQRLAECRSAYHTHRQSIPRFEETRDIKAEGLVVDAVAAQGRAVEPHLGFPLHAGEAEKDALSPRCRRGGELHPVPGDGAGFARLPVAPLGQDYRFPAGIGEVLLEPVRRRGLGKTLRRIFHFVGKPPGTADRRPLPQCRRRRQGLQVRSVLGT